MGHVSLRGDYGLEMRHAKLVLELKPGVFQERGVKVTWTRGSRSELRVRRRVALHSWWHATTVSTTSADSVAAEASTSTTAASTSTTAATSAAIASSTVWPVSTRGWKPTSTCLGLRVHCCSDDAGSEVSSRSTVSETYLLRWVKLSRCCRRDDRSAYDHS